jgi:hypothetical protein
MDYFKIFTLIFMIFITYKLYFNESKLEGFEGTQQSLGGVDDTNAINTLAQIAKNLMAGGVTVPGNMRVNGDISTGEGKVSINNGTINLTSDGGGGLYFLKSGSVPGDKVWNKLYTGDLFVNGNNNIGGSTVNNGNVFFGGTGPAGFNWGNEGGNGWSCLRANAGKTDDSFCMHNTHGGGTRLLPGGDMTVKGRNILAEIDDIKRNYVKYDSIVSNQRVHDGAFVWGDGRGNPDSVWSNWYIHRDNGMR